MKKFINAPEDVEHQVVDGYVKAYPDLIAKAADDIVVRAQPKRGRVALVSGGGMGHEPAHLGYVGPGVLDAAVGGAVFTSPAVDRISAGISAVADAGASGVLLVVKNYTGDVLNFKMAEEAAREDGLEVDHVIVDDDVAVEGSSFTVGRRGVAGTVLVHKCAGAAAEAGLPLPEVKRVAEKVVAGVRTMGVAIGPCTVPAAGKPGFELADDEMEMGVGIHGEPGVRRAAMEPVDAMVDEILEHILADLDYAGSDAAVLVNGAGGTPPYELAIVANRVRDVLAARGVRVWRTYMGEYMTSLEMRGFSVSLLKLDDELKRLLAAPAAAPGWREGAAGEGAAASTEPPMADGSAAGAGSVSGAVPAAPDAAAASGASAPAPADAPAVPASDGAPASGAGSAPGAGLSSQRVAEALAAAAAAMRAHKDELTALDGPIGDSDHGVNMARGFGEVEAQLPELAALDVPQLLKRAGATVVSRVGGSSGPLYGTLLRKLGVAAKRAGGLTLASFADGLQKGFDGIRDLAGAQPGDKTMLDAMEPAIASLRASVEAGAFAHEALDAAARAADAGAEATVPLVARKGRAAYLGERSRGHKDPGAASFACLMRALADLF